MPPPPPSSPRQKAPFLLAETLNKRPNPHSRKYGTNVLKCQMWAVWRQGRLKICNWKEKQNAYIPFIKYKDDYFFQDQTFVYLSCSHGKLKNLFLQLADRAEWVSADFVATLDTLLVSHKSGVNRPRLCRSLLKVLSSWSSIRKKVLAV